MQVNWPERLTQVAVQPVSPCILSQRTGRATAWMPTATTPPLRSARHCHSEEVTSSLFISLLVTDSQAKPRMTLQDEPHTLE